MAIYAIGDLQGCLSPLKKLLEKINYDPAEDTLWFTGDLINRGPDSLETLRYVHQLPKSTVSVLGNHDLTLIAAFYGAIAHKPTDTYREILDAPDGEALIHWLQERPFLHHDPQHHYTLTHAGIYPLWDLETAQQRAQEAESELRTHPAQVSHYMYGNEPSYWIDTHPKKDRIRFIINAFTRMRFCDLEGHLNLTVKSGIDHPPRNCVPWFDFPNRKTQKEKIIFGHWAALSGQCSVKNVFAIDSGCVWGNALTAFCLETQQTFSVPCR